MIVRPLSQVMLATTWPAACDKSPGRRELGIISDLDKTIIPPHDHVLPATAYPGVAQLMRELEQCQRGDMYYVTARPPEMLNGIAVWLYAHGLPGGRIEGGVSHDLARARQEKVRDIRAILDAHPGQKFVLFGDTKHVDPEVFSDVLASHGAQVAAALLHRVRPIETKRTQGTIVFDDYTEAAVALYRRGILDAAAARRVLIAAQRESGEQREKNRQHSGGPADK